MPTRASRFSIVVLCTMALALVSLGRYGMVWAGTVTCCCGEHNADNDCGCPECPSSGEPQDDEPSLDAKVKNCQSSWLQVTAQATHLAPSPDAFVVVPPSAVRALRRKAASPHWDDPLDRLHAPDS